MIIYVNSDLFASPARTLVNTVNTEGVMGKGVALAFKKRYPAMYEGYRDLAKAGKIDVGVLWLYKSPDRWILNFPTKTTWRKPSQPEYIESGLKKFVSSYTDFGIDTISFPLLGCGNGELDWDDVVRPLMEGYLKPLPIPVYIHLRIEPETFVPEHREPDLFSAPAPTRFEDFWGHLRQLAEQNPELRTLSRGSPFRLAYVDDDESVLVFLRDTDTEVRIPKSDLLDLWHRLQLFGSVTARRAPGRIGRESGLVFALLAELPYIDPVTMAESFDQAVRNPSTGIQLRFSYRPIETEAARLQLA